MRHYACGEIRKFSYIFTTWLKLISRWLMASWKHTDNTLLITATFFKIFNFQGIWDRITIFGHLGPKTRFSAYLGLKSSVYSG